MKNNNFIDKSDNENVIIENLNRLNKAKIILYDKMNTNFIENDEYLNNYSQSYVNIYPEITIKDKKNTISKSNTTSYLKNMQYQKDSKLNFNLNDIEYKKLKDNSLVSQYSLLFEIKDKNSFKKFKYQTSCFDFLSKVFCCRNKYYNNKEF